MPILIDGAKVLLFSELRNSFLMFYNTKPLFLFIFLHMWEFCSNFARDLKLTLAIGYWLLANG